MMEFLDKIYGYENFGIILFTVIMLLVVLFLVILFFGKKDEKKREIERTQQLEKQAADTFAQTNTEGIAVEANEPTFSPVEDIVTPITESAPIEQAMPDAPIVEEEPIFPVEEPALTEVTPVIDEVPISPVLEPIAEPTIAAPINNVVPEVTPEPIVEPVVTPEVKLETVEIPGPEVMIQPVVEEEPKAEIEIPNFNFDELAASIANELSALENSNKTVVNEIHEPVKNPEPSPIITPIVNNEVPVTPIKEIVEPKVEAPKPTPGPVTFSSVYINKPAEPTPVEPVVPVTPVVESEPIREVVVEPVANTVSNPTPVKLMPNIDLPKPAEMPILKDNLNSNPVNNPTPTVTDFSQFEGESYDIK